MDKLVTNIFVQLLGHIKLIAFIFILWLIFVGVCTYFGETKPETFWAKLSWFLSRLANGLLISSFVALAVSLLFAGYYAIQLLHLFAI